MADAFSRDPAADAAGLEKLRKIALGIGRCGDITNWLFAEWIDETESKVVLLTHFGGVRISPGRSGWRRE